MRSSPHKPLQSEKKQFSRPADYDDDLTDNEDSESEIAYEDTDLEDDESDLGSEELDLKKDDIYIDEDGVEYFDAIEEQPIEEASLTSRNQDKELITQEKKLFISLKKIQAKELFQNLLKNLDGKNIELNYDKKAYKDEIKEGFLRSINLSMSGFGNDMYEDAKSPSFTDQLSSAVSGFPVETKLVNYKKSSLNSSQLNELKKLIAKAVDKLADEKKLGKNSLETKPSYWWHYMPVVFTIRTIVGMCNSIGKYMGAISPSSADLFLQAAKYGQKIKNEFERDQRERNELNRMEGRNGPLGDLIKHGRKVMSQDERGVLELQAEVTAHDQKNKYEDRRVFQVTKEKRLVKDGQKYDPRKKVFVNDYVEKDIAKLHVGVKVAKKDGGLEKLQAAFRGNFARRNMMNQELPKVVNVLRSHEWQVTHETLEELKRLTENDYKITESIQVIEKALVPGERRLYVEELAGAIDQDLINKTLIKLNNQINERSQWYDVEEREEGRLFSELSNQIDSYIEKIQDRAEISKDMKEALNELRKEGEKSTDFQKYLEVVEKELFSKGISFSEKSVAGNINADKVTGALEDLKEVIERDSSLTKLAKRFNGFNEKIADYLENMKDRSEEINEAIQKEAVQISEDKAALKDYWKEKVATRKALNSRIRD